MSKIDLSVPPYFDDFNENKKFYKILFRPGRAVQTRELNQLQSILQNQIARLGGFKQGDLVHPEHTIGVRFFNNTVFVKVPQSQSSLTLTKNQVEQYWLNKTIESQTGVKGVVSGYSFSTTGDNTVRLYVDLTEASSTTGKNNFAKGDTIKTGAGAEQISVTVENTKYAVGRICKVKIPKSIYFFNEHFVLVDEQTLFLEPDNKADDSAWNTYVTCDIGIKMTESIVNYSSDDSLLDNATGTPNFGGIGADRLRIEGNLVKRANNNIEQNFIKLLVIQNGTITDAPLISKESIGLMTDAEAKRTYEESGNYTVTPFIAEAREFLDDGSGNRGLFSEINDLSFGWSDEDSINEDIARSNAANVARTVFKLNPPQTCLHNNRYYPGTSYDQLNDATSFKNLCDSMFGIQVEPGRAYVYGYPVTRIGTTKIGVRKSRTSDIQLAKKIETPIGNYVLITNVFGALEFNEDWKYDDVELHSKILDLSVNEPSAPELDTKIGTARVSTISLQSGFHGSKNAVYQLAIFDFKLDDGFEYSDIKSIYSASRSVNGKMFLANLVLRDAERYPSLVFDGTIEKISAPYSIEASADVSITKLSDLSGIKIDFSTLSARDEAFSALTLGTCVNINQGLLSGVVTDIKKVDTATDLEPQDQEDEFTATSSQNREFVLSQVPIINDSFFIRLNDSQTPIQKTGSVVEYEPVDVVDGNNSTFTLEYAPIETQTERVKVKISNEPLVGVVNGVNRVFSTSNAAINSAVALYKSTNNGQTYTLISADDYSVAGSKITFKIIDGVSKAPSTGTLIKAEYLTNIFSTTAKTITLSFPPAITSDLLVTYKYDIYTVNNKQVAFADALEDGDTVTVNYEYLNKRRLEVRFDTKITDNTVDRIKIIRKIRGIGTSWKSRAGQSVKKGDWVRIGSGEKSTIYQVYSTPSNDNELNLDPDPLEKQIVDGQEVLVNAPWDNGAKMTYLTAESLRETTSEYNCGLLYKLPHLYVKTIRGGSKNAPTPDDIATTYETRRYEVQQTQGGNITITANENEYFPAFSNLYSLVDLYTGYWFQLFGPDTAPEDSIGDMNPDRPETFTARVVVNTNADGASASNVTFQIKQNVPLRKVAICLPVIKSSSAAKEASKILEKGSFIDDEYTGPAVVVTSDDVVDISLGKADVLRVSRIVCADDGGKYQATPSRKQFDGTLVEGSVTHKDITGAYIFDNGQTDHYYGIGKVKLRPGFPKPQGQIRVEFDYFRHTVSGSTNNYFSVDSYTNSGCSYEEIPSHTTSSGNTFDLKQCLDFRPRVNDNVPEILGQKNFEYYKEVPLGSVTCTYHVYEGRKDRLYVSKDGDILVKEGAPSIITTHPSEADDGMTIYKVNVEPYTTSAEACTLEMVDNKRYTMRDIGKLETRIKNLENVTSLSLLEKDTKELIIKDALGQDKFKHGFMTDTFENPTVAAIGHPDFTAAFDAPNSELKPSVEDSHVELMESVLMIQDSNRDTTIQLQNVERVARNYTRSNKDTPTKTSSLYTLNYDNVTFIEQPLCSRVINVNPYAVQSFIGTLKISPWTDTWRETFTAPPLIIQDETEYLRTLKNFNGNKSRIDWGLTQQEWTGTFENDPKPNGKIKVVEASLHWPVKDGTYLVQSTIKDENGNTKTDWVPKQFTKADLVTKPNTWVKIPPGYKGEGEYVPLVSNKAKVQHGYNVVRGIRGFEFRTGIKNTLVDLGYSNPIISQERVVNISAAQFIRSNEVQYEGRGFFPNTRLYAYFDGVDVTKYCYPDVGFGSVEEDTQNIIFSGSDLVFKFDLTSISTSHENTLLKVAGLTYAEIADPNNKLDFAVLTGEVTTEGTTLRGSYSTLEPAGNLTDFSEFSISAGDILEADDVTGTKTQGVVTSVSSDKTKIYFNNTSSTTFNPTGETIYITNNKQIVVSKEICPQEVNDTNYTFTLEHTPIEGSGANYQPLIVYLYDSTTDNEIYYELKSSWYTITPNTRTIRFVNNTSPLKLQFPGGPPNQNAVWQIKVDYTYVGSNYTVSNELATIDDTDVTKKTYNIRHAILKGTRPTVTVNGSESLAFSFTPESSSIVFDIAPADGSTVRVTYVTTTQQITGKQTNVGTLFKAELVPGSTIIFPNGVEKEIVSITDNSTAVMKSAIGAGDITTKTKCADKLEALQTKYEGKYVDISNATNEDRNILNKVIYSIEYTPESETKLKFNFHTSLMMPPIDSEKMSLVIKHEEIGKNAKTRKAVLKCNESGKIKGRFCIPDPKVDENPKFRTGDRTFRLTNSPRNESLPSVSRAEAGYSATGWVDTKQRESRSIREFRVDQSAVSGERKPITLKHVFEEWGKVCATDPVAQSFSVPDKDGIFITAVDVFFYSKDPVLPVRLQIRPLADGGTPSNILLYEKSIDANEVVVNKVDLKTQTVTVKGATAANAREGFNKGPWNTEATAANGIYNVNSYAYDKGLSSLIINENQAVDYSFGTNESIKNAHSYMIPTRFVLDYPLYLEGNKKNYCFVLLSDSVPPAQAGGDLSVLENTYQVYFAQTGKATLHQELSTPVHRQTPLEAGEDELNFILGTNEVITSIPQSDGQLFKSQNGISWVGDPLSDLKYKIHKAKFNTNTSADIVFVNEDLPYTNLQLSPFECRKGSSLLRVNHPNHGFTVGSLVSFTGLEGDLNGIMPQQIIEPKIHTIVSAALDSYIIDLGAGNEATISGNFGGAGVLASKNIRFEEIMVLTSPLEVADTSVTWRVSSVSSAAPDDSTNTPYVRIDDIPLVLNASVPVGQSLQVCSTKNETKIQANETTPWARKSLKIIATLSSTNENISPVIDAERLGVALKTVRLNKPEGTGYQRNINNEVFDTFVCLPSTLLDQASIRGKLFFSDTDNMLTGSSFLLNNKTITGVGSLFTVDLKVGDKIKNPTNSEIRTIVDIASDVELTIDSPFNVTAGANEIGQSVDFLTSNPSKLKFKTADKLVGERLSKLEVGKYVSLSGTEGSARDFYQVLVTNVSYTPNSTEIDTQLGAPKICEIEVDHSLPNNVSAGFEFGSDSEDIRLVQLEQFIHDIGISLTSSASKYISREMILANAANTVKVMFDGCRPPGAEIDLYYKTSTTDTSIDLFEKPWTKLEYSVENNSTLTFAKPPNNTDHDSFSSYEANALDLQPFMTLQIKVVLRGEDASKYPKIRNLRIMALEE